MNKIKYHIIASTLIATANLFSMEPVDCINSQKICMYLLYKDAAQLRNLVDGEQKGKCCSELYAAEKALHEVFEFSENGKMRVVPEDFDKRTLQQLCFSEKTFFFLKDIIQKPMKAKKLIAQINCYDYYESEKERKNCLDECRIRLESNCYIANDHGSYKPYADKRMTPLHYILIRVADGALSEETGKLLCELLLSYGSNVNARDNAGNTPSHYAPTPCLTDFLYLNGADPSIAGDLGRTPLLNFIRLENWPVVKKLLLYSSAKDINKQDDEGNTPLGEAVRLGNEEIVQLLLGSGAH